MRGYKLNHLAINSNTAVAAEARVIPALAATILVEFMAKWSNLCPLTVHLCKHKQGVLIKCIFSQALFISHGKLTLRHLRLAPYVSWEQ